MARYLYLVFVTQLFISEAISSYPNFIQYQPFPSYKQYYQPNYQSYVYPRPKVNQPIPSLPAVQNPQPNVVRKIIQPSINCEKSIPKVPEQVDTQVLNNLAIALQLLIMNNVINNPSKDTNLLPVSEKILELASKLQTPCDVSYQMPNAKFLGSSNFGDDGMVKNIAGFGSLGPSPPKPPALRSGFGLISPYDALSNPAHSERLASSFRSQNDFLNPYAAISATDSYKDLFSLDF